VSFSLGKGARQKILIKKRKGDHDERGRAFFIRTKEKLDHRFHEKGGGSWGGGGGKDGNLAI